jgi:hypothetical protein
LVAPGGADARLDVVARAIERCTNDFSARVFRLIEPEARLRWEREHPARKDALPEANWNFESYRLIARAVLAELDRLEAQPEQRTVAAGQSCSAATTSADEPSRC